MELTVKSDCVVVTGHSKQICQDYALATNKSMVICDGCSSSQHTDVGARLLAWATINEIENFDSINIGEGILRRASLPLAIMGIPEIALDSTIVLAFQLGNCIQTYTYGDGVLFGVTNKGILRYTYYSYEKEAPEYLSYQLSKSRYQSWKDLLQGIECTEFDGFKETTDGDIAIDLSPYKNCFGEDIVIAGIASDGLLKISNKDSDRLPLGKVLKDLTNFKNTTGEFLKRRVKRVLKEYNELGYYPMDDLGIAVMVQS